MAKSLCTTGLAFIFLSLIGGCAQLRSTYAPIRYRLTAEVQTPRGVVQASRVLEVTFDRPARGYTMRGEAVPITLLPGKTVFMTLQSPTHVDWPADAILAFDVPDKADDRPVMPKDRDAFDKRRFDEIRNSRRPANIWLRKGSAERVASDSPGPPLLVYFDNIADPRTVRRINPEDFSRYFGEGYDLQSVKIAATSDEVVFTIPKMLPWLKDLRGSLGKDGDMRKPLAEIPPEQLLSQTAFIHGDPL